ncbi:hypothetical protein EVAR_88212_1 [Eumeta japonica]|uniref:Uncharacterized protein n=1 Tax=Eumeta variegata TaxID=151549 RepID=A0A4C1Z3D4_EUMVA|nr:hypothetical protein EVAR_88212_1 [Eumeta japonica]
MSVAQNIPTGWRRFLAPPLARQDVIEDESSSIPESVVEPPEAYHSTINTFWTNNKDLKTRKVSFCFIFNTKIPSNLWKKFSWRAVSTLKYYQEKGMEAGPVRRWSAQLHAYTYKTSTTTG